MSSPQKLRGKSAGQPDSELTKFKKLWLFEFGEHTRDYWKAQFISDTRQAEVRQDIKLKHGINLTRDPQLNEFRAWLERQDQLNLEAEQVAEDESRLIAEHGDWTLETIREEVLKRSYARAMTTGNFADGRATMRSDLAERSAKFNAELETAKLKLAQEAELRARAEFQLAREKFELDAAEKMLSAAIRQKADELNASNLSQADKIAAMRKAAFSDVDELQRSGKIQIPRA